MVNITVTIPDAKISEFKTHFLYIHPVPIDEETGEPKYTAAVWIKKWLRRQMIHAYRSGKKRKIMDEFQVSYELE